MEQVLSSWSGSALTLLMKPFMDTQNLPLVSEQWYMNIYTSILIWSILQDDCFKGHYRCVVTHNNYCNLLQRCTLMTPFLPLYCHTTAFTNILRCMYNFVYYTTFFLFAVACRTPITPDQGQWQNPLPWYLPGHILTFTCAEGFGPLESDNVTCQFDGGWSGGQPLCTSKMLLLTAFIIQSIFNYIFWSGPTVYIYIYQWYNIDFSAKSGAVFGNTFRQKIPLLCTYCSIYVVCIAWYVGRSIPHIYNLGGILTSGLWTSINISPWVVYIGYGPPCHSIQSHIIYI